VETFGTAKQTTDNNTIRDMSTAYWKTKTKDTHSLLFHGISGYANTPQCYVYTYTTDLSSPLVRQPKTGRPSDC
jgi:hypothetical protein